ncbi:MAG: GDSL-type esterase/lipase family protein [archaeon]
MKGILVFGESTSFGRGDNENGGWSGRLKRYFESKDYYNVVYNLGVPGQSSTDLLERFDIEAKARTKKIWPNDEFTIIFAIGTNDSKGLDTPDNVKTPLDKFKKNILTLIDESKKFTDKIVFIGLIPVNEDITNPYENTYFFNERTKQYNEVIKNCCKDNNILFIDMFDDWFKSDYKTLLGDGVHPNSKGYEKIFLKVKETLFSNLQ